MLAALLLGALPATGMIQTRQRAILTYTVEAAEDAHWAEEPSAAEIADTPAARLPGGARAKLQCTADKSGRLTGCEVAAAEPDRAEVRDSALKLAGAYWLDKDGTQKVRWSHTPPIIWLPILFPDHEGRVPNDCHPAFGCIIEHMPSPPPPPHP